MSIVTESTLLINKRNQKKGYKHEFKWLLKNAMPLVISYLLQNSLQSVSIITAGHLVSLLFFLSLYFIYLFTFIDKSIYKNRAQMN